MLRFEYFVELKNGFRQTMETEEENEVRFTIEAKNRVTAERMVKALLKDNQNVESYGGVCVSE